MKESQAKGYILEGLVKAILEKQGYKEIPPEIWKNYNIEQIKGDLRVRGRGTTHQIDAIGQFGYQIPFVYPIRLLCEAKCHKGKIGIDTIRNFVGVLKDISENYFVKKNQDYSQRGRFTDVAAIFSTSPFSADSQTYAYAHGIFLVPCSNLSEEINLIYDSLNKNDYLSKKIIENYFRRRFPITNIEYIYFANIIGNYPILIKSNSPFPIELFKDEDQHNIRLTFEKSEKFNKKLELKFIINLGEWKGSFDIPEYILKKSPDKLNPQEILTLKEIYINEIKIPIITQQVKRIISLNLDSEWIDQVRKYYRETNKSSYLLN